LIDPQDIIIGSGGTIDGATLSAQLVTTNIVLDTATGAGAALPGNGDIFVNEEISWTASSGPTTLTLNAVGDVHINKAISATNGNLEVCCGRDINVAADITTVRGSVLLNAGRDVNMNAAITATDGNIMICAANDVNVNGAITLTNGTTVAGQSLGLPRGLVLIAGYGGNGPGPTANTLRFAGAPKVTVTNAPVVINYNPVSYAAPTNYSGNFTLTEGATLTQRMLVFADGGDKAFDGTTGTTLSSLKGNPAGVELVAGPGSSANYDTAQAGTGKRIFYSGYSLAGANANDYALAVNCCGPVFARTTGNIAAAATRPPVVPGLVLPGGRVVPGALTPDGTPLASLPLWPIIQPVPPAIVPPGPVPSWMAPPMLALRVAPPADLPSMMLTEERPAAPPIPYIAPVFIPKHERN
jgi:hypothetical protein